MQELISKFSLFGLAALLVIFVVIVWRLPPTPPEEDAPKDKAPREF